MTSSERKQSDKGLDQSDGDGGECLTWGYREWPKGEQESENLRGGGGEWKFEIHETRKGRRITDERRARNLISP